MRWAYTALQASLLRSNDATTYLFLTADGTPVETLTLPFVIRPAQAATTDLPPAASLAEFGEGVYLLDSDIRPPAQPGQPFEISADWTTAAPLDANYTIFAHLVDADGQIIAQQDQQPLGGRYPTSGLATRGSGQRYDQHRGAGRSRGERRSACVWGCTICVRSFACRAATLRATSGSRKDVGRFLEESAGIRWVASAAGARRASPSGMHRRGSAGSPGVTSAPGRRGGCGTGRTPRW